MRFLLSTFARAATSRRPARSPRSPFLPRVIAVLALLVAARDAAAALDFLNPPPGAEMRLELLRRFAHEELPDTSTGPPLPTSYISPVDLEFFPDGSGDALLVQSTGMITWLAPDFSIRGHFSVASANSLASFLETGEFWDNEGLLGLAFDPAFAQNRWFYVHTNPEPRSGVQIWRLTWNAANLAAIWDSRQLVLDVPKPQIADNPDYLHNHNGGNLLFGPDGMLYVLLGDGGIGGSNPALNQSQSPDSLWGKVLRVDPSGVVPPEILARGARNPFTSTWFGDALLIGDVGADDGDHWEEVNLLPLGETGPVPNFGWNVYPGPCWAFAASPADCAGFVDPIHGYRKDDAFVDEDPDATPGPPGTVYVTALIVGPVSGSTPYDGYLENVLVYADFVQGWVRGALLADDGRVLADRHLLHYHGLIPGLVRAPDGSVYLLGNDLGHVEIHRLTGPNVAPPPPPPVDGPPLVDHPTDPLPLHLSRTGFYPDFPSLRPHPRAIRYAPLFPLWSNGSDKDRFLLLPPGTSVDTSDPERWVFPTGTLFVKHFGYARTAGGRREVETRVLQKAEDGWRFGTYVWRDDQREAVLSDGRPVSVPLAGVRGAVPHAFTYEVPGTAQCRTCHARQDDVVLGFEPVQLGRPMVRAFEAFGVLGTAHEAAPQTVAGTDWLDSAVRGYLHANCAHCHSPEGGLAATLGFSLDHRATDGVVGLPSRRGRGPLVVPGDPAASPLLLMLAGSPALPRMAPVGNQVVDVSAVSLVSEWIRALGDDVPDASHPPGRDRVQVIELYHPGEDRYVLAVGEGEAAALEASLGGAGWRRSGYGFAAWRAPATQIPGPRAVLRRTSGANGPPSSRLAFRTVPAAIRRATGEPQTEVAFYLYPPEDGSCPRGHAPVYQASIRRTGTPSLLFRYTDDWSVYAAMVAEGWRGDGVELCAPR